MPVDRGQTAVFIARSVVSPTGEAGLASYVPPATASFPDVPKSYWAYKQVEYLHAHDLVRGYPEGNYRPGVPVFRDQMATFVSAVLAVREEVYRRRSRRAWVHAMI